MQKAKEVNMPQENVTRAIKKGTGELEGSSIRRNSLMKVMVLEVWPFLWR